MAPKNEVKFYLLETEKGTRYAGGYGNELEISNTNSHVNTYFNIDIQQSAYFTMLIEGFEYNRFHTQTKASLAGLTPRQQMLAGRNDFYFKSDPSPVVDSRGNLGDGSKTFDASTNDVHTNWINANIKSTNWQGKFKGRKSEYWLPLKSLQYSQGSIEALSLSTSTFSDLRLPFRKQSPTLTVEMYDHRSDFFEMKLREWHSESVLIGGFVPVIESIKKSVKICGYSTNGDCNYETTCDCILIDDIVTHRSYEDNGLKVIQFKMLIVGY